MPRHNVIPRAPDLAQNFVGDGASPTFFSTLMYNVALVIEPPDNSSLAMAKAVLAGSTGLVVRPPSS